MFRLLSFALVALALPGCDRLLRLDDVHYSRDGSVGDTPPAPDASIVRDAPSACAGAAPIFAGQGQTLVNGCSHYTVGKNTWSPGDLGIASCTGVISSVDAATGILTPEQGPSGVAPAQSGDGELYVNASGMIYKYTQATPADHWGSPVLQSVPGVGAMDGVTGPSGAMAAPVRRMVLFHFTTVGWSVSELAASQPDTWISLGTIDTNLSAVVSGPGALSHDGLRLVFMGATGVMYASRADTSARFSAATEILGVNGTSPYLSEDCTKLYYTNSLGQLTVAIRTGP